MKPRTFVKNFPLISEFADNDGGWWHQYISGVKDINEYAETHNCEPISLTYAKTKGANDLIVIFRRLGHENN